VVGTTGIRACGFRVGKISLQSIQLLRDAQIALERDYFSAGQAFKRRRIFVDSDNDVSICRGFAMCSPSSRNRGFGWDAKVYAGGVFTVIDLNPVDWWWNARQLLPSRILCQEKSPEELISTGDCK